MAFYFRTSETIDLESSFENILEKGKATRHIRDGSGKRLTRNLKVREPANENVESECELHHEEEASECKLDMSEGGRLSSQGVEIIFIL